MAETNFQRLSATERRDALDVVARRSGRVHSRRIEVFYIRDLLP